MTRHARACVLSLACTLVTAAAARGEILDGVQPGALDQPRINAIIYVGANSNPQIGETEDPLGGIFGGGDTIRYFNIQAYLDTGASGILISTPSAAALQIPTESVGGQPVIYSDVGVGSTPTPFNVSVPIRLSLASMVPGVDLDQFTDPPANTLPITTPYVPVSTPPGVDLRLQIGPYVPTVDNPGMDDIEDFIQLLIAEQSAVNVIGMPALQGRVMVVDNSGVKSLGLLFGLLGGVITGDGDIGDITDADLESLTAAGINTYLYSRPTAPTFDAGRAGNPGIPTPDRRVKLTYASFDRFTSLHLANSTTIDHTLPSPTLAPNPFIGKNPVALLDGTDPGDAPGITVTREVTGSTLSFTGNWLLDTGAAASILSETQAKNFLQVIYGTPTVPDQAPFLVDAITGDTILNQFSMVLGGIDGQHILSGFYLDTLVLPTTEAIEQNNPALNLIFTNVPVLVGDVTLVDPLDPTKKITLDGIFGMNMLIESIDFQTDELGNLVDLAAPSPTFFSWFTVDLPDPSVSQYGELGLVFDPEVVTQVPEPTSLALLGGGAMALMLRRRRR